MLTRQRFVVYGGTGHHELDGDVLKLVNSLTHLGLAFSHTWHHTWPDGEPGFRLENPGVIQGRHVLIFACPITYKLESELRDLVTVCKQQYEAKSVTVLLSFLRFRRQDRPELTHEITRLRWFIRSLRFWGADRLIVCEPHSIRNTKGYCDEFGLTLHVADPTRLFAEAIAPVIQTLGGADKVRIYSPDLGSVGRALALARLLGLRVVATPKRRVNTRIELVEQTDFMQSVGEIFGPNQPISCDLNNIADIHLITREDEVDSGGTAVATARMLVGAGAAGVHLVATHPVCSRGWKMRFFPHGEPPPFMTIWLGNTRPRGDGETEYEGSTGERVKKVDIAPAIAEVLIEVLEEIAD